jgi:hypothetical protein
MGGLWCWRFFPWRGRLIIHELRSSALLLSHTLFLGLPFSVFGRRRLQLVLPARGLQLAEVLVMALSLIVQALLHGPDRATNLIALLFRLPHLTLEFFNALTSLLTRLNRTVSTI